MRPRKLFIATGNQHKIEELQAMLEQARVDITVCSPNGVGGMPPVIEDADSFVGNALLKARALAEKVADKNWILADDSGLVVDALDGAPGVYSSRYAGEAGDDAANNARLLQELAYIPEENRTARFVCSLVLLVEGNAFVFEGKVEGKIGFTCKGQQGFGYDPLFIPAGHTVTMAELGQHEKNTISHRANALHKLLAWIKAQ